MVSTWQGAKFYLIDHSEFGHRHLADVIAFNAQWYSVTPYLGGLQKRSLEFSQSWSVLNVNIGLQFEEFQICNSGLSMSHPCDCYLNRL